MGIPGADALPGEGLAALKNDLEMWNQDSKRSNLLLVAICILPQQNKPHKSKSICRLNLKTVGFSTTWLQLPKKSTERDLIWRVIPKEDRRYEKDVMLLNILWLICWRYTPRMVQKVGGPAHSEILYLKHYMTVRYIAKWINIRNFILGNSF